jgi:hypothetical protein
MNDYNINVKLNEVITALKTVKEDIESLKKTVKSEDDLWDGSDMVRNWHVSERTLATWRSNGTISYVQVNGKIWYPRQAREELLSKNFIQNKYE